MLDRQVELNVKGNNYVIEFPNVGLFQNIETMKQVLSKGMYSSLMSMGTVSSSEALDMIDMEAYFSILCPKLIKDLKCDNFGELGLEDYMELKVIYRDNFIPWWSNILELLSPKKKL
jgi:hypothetical protein